MAETRAATEERDARDACAIVRSEEEWSRRSRGGHTTRRAGLWRGDAGSAADAIGDGNSKASRGGERTLSAGSTRSEEDASVFCSRSVTPGNRPTRHPACAAIFFPRCSLFFFSNARCRHPCSSGPSSMKQTGSARRVRPCSPRGDASLGSRRAERRARRGASPDRARDARGGAGGDLRAARLGAMATTGCRACRAFEVGRSRFRGRGGLDGDRRVSVHATTALVTDGREAGRDASPRYGSPGRTRT